MTESGAAQSARQAEPSQEKPAEHSKVQSPGDAEKFQFPETDWEEALDSAWGIPVPGAVPPQASSTQYGPEGPEAGTYPDSQEADSEERVTAPNEQDAVAERVPRSAGLETGADCPETRSGTG